MNSRFALLILCLLTVPVFAEDTEQQAWTNLIEQLNTTHPDPDALSRAIPDYLAAVQDFVTTYPNSDRVQEAVGFLFNLAARHNRIDEGIERLTALHEILPDDTRCWAPYFCGLLHVQAKQFDEAQTQFEKTLAAPAPDSVHNNARIFRAQCVAILGDIGQFRELMKRLPDKSDADVDWILARTFVDFGSIDDAIRYLDAFLRAHPKDARAAEAWSSLAESHLRNNDEDATYAAIRALEKAQTETDLKEHAARRLAETMIHFERYAEAESQLRAVIARSSIQDHQLLMVRLLINVIRDQIAEQQLTLEPDAVRAAITTRINNETLPEVAAALEEQSRLLAWLGRPAPPITTLDVDSENLIYRPDQAKTWTLILFWEQENDPSRNWIDILRNRLAAELPLTVIGVCMTTTRTAALEWATTYNVPFPTTFNGLVPDEGKRLAELFGCHLVPTCLLVDPDGIIRGADLSMVQVDKLVK
jgi:tetratricopeptide (TPR) repeat protein